MQATQRWPDGHSVSRWQSCWSPAAHAPARQNAPLGSAENIAKWTQQASPPPQSSGPSHMPVADSGPAHDVDAPHVAPPRPMQQACGAMQLVSPHPT